jgi:hypothetical protein
MYNGMGGYKYGLRGAQPGWCVISGVCNQRSSTTVKQKKKRVTMWMYKHTTGGVECLACVG